MKALEDLSVRYDDTVRNSVGGVVQFAYGDDSLDPILMESARQPVDFGRQWQRSVAQFGFDGETLKPRAFQVREASRRVCFVGAESPDCGRRSIAQRLALVHAVAAARDVSPAFARRLLVFLCATGEASAPAESSKSARNLLTARSFVRQSRATSILSLAPIWFVGRCALAAPLTDALRASLHRITSSRRWRGSWRRAKSRAWFAVLCARRRVATLDTTIAQGPSNHASLCALLCLLGWRVELTPKPREVVNAVDAAAAKRKWAERDAAPVVPPAKAQWRECDALDVDARSDDVRVGLSFFLSFFSNTHATPTDDFATADDCDAAIEARHRLRRPLRLGGCRCGRSGRRYGERAADDGRLATPLTTTAQTGCSEPRLRSGAGSQRGRQCAARAREAGALRATLVAGVCAHVRVCARALFFSVDGFAGARHGAPAQQVCDGVLRQAAACENRTGHR